MTTLERALLTVVAALAAGSAAYYSLLPGPAILLCLAAAPAVAAARSLSLTRSPEAIVAGLGAAVAFLTLGSLALVYTNTWSSAGVAALVTLAVLTLLPADIAASRRRRRVAA